MDPRRDQHWQSKHVALACPPTPIMPNVDLPLQLNEPFIPVHFPQVAPSAGLITPPHSPSPSPPPSPRPSLARRPTPPSFKTSHYLNGMSLDISLKPRPDRGEYLWEPATYPFISPLTIVSPKHLPPQFTVYATLTPYPYVTILDIYDALHHYFFDPLDPKELNRFGPEAVLAKCYRRTQSTSSRAGKSISSASRIDALPEFGHNIIAYFGALDKNQEEGLKLAVEFGHA